ncbi:hypothetical protein [Microbulbifer sp. TRSA007]|uniref:hypothetical protein n=1 Tax=unclassified Microbulbifer TaxID=2619833 RepID=UPI00403961FD
MDTFLTIGSMLIEFGLPALLVYLILKKPAKRSLLVPVLGAVTPMVLLLIVGTIDHYVFPSEEPSMFMAAFAMSLFIYCILAGVGFLLGLFLPKTVGLRWRYIVGFLLGPAFGLGLIAAW